MNAHDTLEHQLRASVVAQNTKRARPTRRATWSRGLSALVLTTTTALALGVAVLVLLALHHSRSPTSQRATGAPGRQALIATLGVLQRSQNPADRAFDHSGWPEPPASSGTLTQPDRPLIRFAGRAPWGAQIYVVPLKTIGAQSGVEKVALWVQGTGWSDYSSVADIRDGQAWGPLRSVRAGNGALTSRFLEIVPNGVAKVVFYNTISPRPQLHVGSSVTGLVHDNVAVFEDTGGARIIVAAWYSATGRLIRRVGAWNLAELKHATPGARWALLRVFPILRRPRAAIDALPSGYVRPAARYGGNLALSRYLLSAPPYQGGAKLKMWLVPAHGQLCAVEKQGSGGGISCTTDGDAIEHGVIRGFIGPHSAMLFGVLPNGARDPRLIQPHGRTSRVRLSRAGAFIVQTDLPAALAFSTPDGTATNLKFPARPTR